jgi:lipopolysaccharide export system ATP-binding protein
MSKTISAVNIAKSYGKKQVIRDVTISLKQGEIVGLLGPNGAGKTTCFYMLAGLLPCDKGNIFLNDIDITKSPIYQRGLFGISYLPQESSIFRGMTVEENIMSIIEIKTKNKERQKEKLAKLLDELSISHIAKSTAISLSGGEKRRVEIARTLAINPLFIFFDEPFAGVDPIVVNDIMKIIKHLKKKNIGVLITDHNVRETLSIVDRSYIVHDGSILTSGTKSEIIKNQKVKDVYLGDSVDAENSRHLF